MRSARPPQPLPGFAAKRAPPGGRLSGSKTPAGSRNNTRQGRGCDGVHTRHWAARSTHGTPKLPSARLPTMGICASKGLTQLLCSRHLKSEGGEVVASISNLGSQRMQLLLPLPLGPPHPRTMSGPALGLRPPTRRWNASALPTLAHAPARQHAVTHLRVHVQPLPLYFIQSVMNPALFRTRTACLYGCMCCVEHAR